MTLFRSPRAYCLLLGSLVLLLGLSCVLALGFGPARLDSGLVGRIVLQRLFGVAAEPGAWSAGQEHIVWLIRAPRVLLGACVGAGLALVGAALQAVTRNPLADPHLLGATSGATLGAVLVVLYIGEVIGLLTLPLAAFLGALGSMLLVLGVASRGGRLGATGCCWRGSRCPSCSWRWPTCCCSSATTAPPPRCCSGCSAASAWRAGR